MTPAEYKKLTQPKEHYIQTQIINYLWSKGYYVMRLNSGKYSVGEGKSRRFIMGQDAGTPDLMAFKKCETNFAHSELLFIEVKKPGNKPTALQTAKMAELEGYGAQCMVASSVEDLVASGL